MRKFSPILAVYLALVAIGLSACGGGSDAPPDVSPVPQYVYSIPDAIGDGWEVASVADEGLDEELVTTMVRRILTGVNQGIDSVAIARNGKLVLSVQVRDSVGQFDDWIDNTDPERHVLHLSLIHI